MLAKTTLHLVNWANLGIWLEGGVDRKDVKRGVGGEEGENERRQKGTPAVYFSPILLFHLFYTINYL